MTDRQEQPHGVGAHLTTFRLICSAYTHLAGVAAHAPDVSPGQGGSLAHLQLGVPHHVPDMGTVPAAELYRDYLKREVRPGPGIPGPWVQFRE